MMERTLFNDRLAQIEGRLAELDARYVEWNWKLAEQREITRKDLEEKYAADQVSYQAMAKRLELEKQKAAELEMKLEKLKQPAKRKK